MQIIKLNKPTHKKNHLQHHVLNSLYPLYHSQILISHREEDYVHCTPTSWKYIVSEKDRLLFFLIKIKTEIIGGSYSVHRITISTIFYEILQHVASATRKLIFWSDIDAKRETVPHCFLPDYNNTRIIIDCAEFRIVIP